MINMQACTYPYLFGYCSLQYSTEEETEAQKGNMQAARAGAQTPPHDSLRSLMGPLKRLEFIRQPRKKNV